MEVMRRKALNGVFVLKSWLKLFMSVIKWETLITDQFSDYCRNAHHIFFDCNKPPPPFSSAIIGHPAVNNFKKEIIRDPTVVTTLKDNHRLEQWNLLHTKATARAQDIGDILDKTYKPLRPEDQALFIKNNYMYSVFVDKLQIDKGRRLSGFTRQQGMHRNSMLF